ncbi:MAG: hypothetical protein ACKVVP_15285 [Chloroflexota bacterium]
MEAVYAAINARPEIAKFPWDGINIHLHFEHSAGQVTAIFNTLEQIRTAQDDHGGGGILVGEWGFGPASFEEDPAALSRMFNRLKPRASAMFFHAHHQIPIETEPPDDPDWGLRYYSEQPGQPGESGQFVLRGKTNYGLYDAFDALVGS